MSEASSDPRDTHVATYQDIETEVSRHFEGSWERFLKAVQNPAEILHFVLSTAFDKDPQKFETWAKQKALPADWIPRFYGTLTESGELRSPESPPAGAEPPADSEA